MSIVVSKALDKLYADRVVGKLRDAWAARHLEAWSRPVDVELGIRALILGLADYGERHERHLGGKIGEDNSLGPAFQKIAESIIILLNGDLGRFDGGTLDALVRDICRGNGVEIDQ